MEILSLLRQLNEARRSASTCTSRFVETAGDKHWLVHPSVIGFGVEKDRSAKSPLLNIYIDEQVEAVEAVDKRPYRISSHSGVEISCRVLPIGSPGLERNWTQVRPFGPGASISHVLHSKGTLCAKVKLRWGMDPDKTFLLSCHHVLYPVDNRNTRVICQPAKEYIYRDLANSDVIARGIGGTHAAFNAYGTNRIDAGIAEIKPREVAHFTNKILNSSNRITSIARDLHQDMPVTMFGAVSGPKPGFIRDSNFYGRFEYEPNESRRRYVDFHDVVRCDYSSQFGDSGAPVIVTGTRKLAGMHFAGKGGNGYFCKATTIFDKLNIKLPF